MGAVGDGLALGRVAEVVLQDGVEGEGFFGVAGALACTGEAFQLGDDAAVGGVGAAGKSVRDPGRAGFQLSASVGADGDCREVARARDVVFVAGPVDVDREAVVHDGIVGDAALLLIGLRVAEVDRS